MAEQIQVRAKPGIAFPRAAPGFGFVGYEPASGKEQPDDHTMPGGPRYRPTRVAESVPNSVYYRRAIARGDLERGDGPDEADDLSTPFESAG
jgi:hypothetical protein